ncbi:MAG: N-6 DNA methylase [Oscillatoriales cyanobacterium]|nr:MAG: N-6 DNA methylase [Oscillatoriales cyanobacterium]TAF34379.1 MAG: N-6 DNA methylase [Oscillatoriales cyanobacterium]TAF68444.1 MAG: N-6 DNA methylase [Oscillatoriales cyanobacterium]
MRFDTYIQSIQSNLLRGSERTHYPTIKNLLDNPAASLAAIIEEKGNKAGVPDFTVRRKDLLVGYVEAKDVGLDLNPIEKTEQLQRYRESLNGNLILTNYLEFRWYVDGKSRLTAVLATRIGDEITLCNSDKTLELIEGFLNYTGAAINSPEDLAKQMARLTKSILLATESALQIETETGELHQLKRGFNEILLPDLNDAAFADMYAQTISYGLFAARVGHAQNPGNQLFDRRTAGTYIPATNPFLRRLFNSIIETDLLSKINWAIDDLVELLGRVDMTAILENFGSRTRQSDPVVHFYETFLAAYNSALRKSRGVYYTPEPVVSYIVRSVDAILKNRFNLPLGLADNSKNPDTQQPRVQILDPATGTGTFLYGVVDRIYQNLEDMGISGSWNQYVQENLLNRLFGFELLMAPYAIAHLKLGLQLQNLGYEFRNKQRLGVYLTNTLDEALKKSEVLFAQFVAQEANEASAIKRDVPVMVVLGNPPYSGHSANKSEWIAGLVKDYYYVDGVPLKERNSKWLQDDYVKFIRFGQWRVSQTGFGVLAFVTNHGYLDNPTFRGMRQNLMQTFTDIYVLDLHGNSKKKEVSPDGSPDQNVFDIQQGVSIGIFIKEPGKSTPARVHHAELWGSRIKKYNILSNCDIDTTEWKEIKDFSRDYLFTIQNTDLKPEYDNGWQILDIFIFQSMGVTSGDDEFLYDFSVNELKVKIDTALRETKAIKADRTLLRLQRGADQIIDKDWKLCLYRPFDQRAILYCTEILERAREKLASQFQEPNLGFITIRRTREGANTQFFVTDTVTDKSVISSADNANIFPLYIYPDTENEQGNLFTDRTPNLSPNFLSAVREKLGYVPTPEAIFYYAYAVFHTPTYRQRYAEFLKIDFPRLPLTSDNEVFTTLAKKGEELVALHLMKSQKLNKVITKYPVSGDNAVTQVTYNESERRVYINKQQYFEGIFPEVWGFKIGGYQVLDKWLKDRKKANRSLSFDEVLHYQRVVVAMKETMQIMAEIDDVIPGFPWE